LNILCIHGFDNIKYFINDFNFKTRVLWLRTLNIPLSVNKLLINKWLRNLHIARKNRIIVRFNGGSVHIIPLFRWTGEHIIPEFSRKNRDLLSIERMNLRTSAQGICAVTTTAAIVEITIFVVTNITEPVVKGLDVDQFLCLCLRTNWFILNNNLGNNLVTGLAWQWFKGCVFANFGQNCSRNTKLSKKFRKHR